MVMLCYVMPHAGVGSWLCCVMCLMQELAHGSAIPRHTRRRRWHVMPGSLLSCHVLFCSVLFRGREAAEFGTRSGVCLQPWLDSSDGADE